MLLLFTSHAYSEQFVIVERETGDRLTGRFLNASNTHFEIEYNGQVLRFPLEGHTLNFFSELENVPDRNASKYYRNGRDLLDLESPELAKRQFEKALEEFPKFVDAHYQLGRLYKLEGDIDKALQRLRTVSRIDPQKFDDLVPLIQEIGENAEATENYENAVNAFQIILTYFPKHDSVRTFIYRTGFLLTKNIGDKNAGLEMLQKAIRQFPTANEHEEAVYQIGILQSAIGEFENALNTFNQFITIYPNSEWVDDAHLNRAITYLKTGNTVNAVEEAKRVRQISNDTDIIAQADEVLRASAWRVYTHDLPDINIQAIASDGNSLWIGTPKGIAQVEINDNGGWNAVEAAAWIINDKTETVPDVTAIAVNEAGVWVGTRSQGVIHFNKATQKANLYPIAGGSQWIRDIKLDEYEIWFATDRGVVRQMHDTGRQFHYHGNDPVPNDVRSLALTEDTVWVGTSGDNIAVFDRRFQTWEAQNFYDIDTETQIVKFDVVADKMVFSWYNEENKKNGVFIADWDGSNGKAYPVSDGTDEKTELEDILITGTVDRTISNIPPENNQEVRPIVPLILWLAMSDYVAIDYTRTTQEWDGYIEYPKIVLEDSNLQCITVDKNRAWIGTTKGILTIDLQTIGEQELEGTNE